MGEAAGLGSSTLEGGKKTTAHQQTGWRGDCGSCGARRIDSQLGLEKTPDGYVANLVAVFREVKRVLRDDGCVFLNLGDSYYNRNPAGNDSFRAKRPKDLVGVPWRVAFALQQDGWYLRSDIIWSKPNPMPESVKDRPTRSHEYVFLLTKSARYFFDQEAVREPNEHPDRSGTNGARAEVGRPYPLRGPSDLEPRPIESNPAGRNIRSVWNIATQPYAEAHFATFPTKLVEPCVLAGSAEGDLVLDPFCGSGTVGVVALRHDRSFIGLELNPHYCEMARNRIRDDAPLLNTGLEVAA